MKNASTVESGQQFGRRLPAALVQYGVRNIGQVIGGGVAEQQGLDQCGGKQYHPAGRVFEECKNFFAYQRSDLRQRGEERGHGITPAFYAVWRGWQQPEPARTGLTPLYFERWLAN